MRGPGLIMIPWQVKLIYEFGAQKSGEQPDSSSQPARGVVVFPGAASVPGTPLSLVCCPLLSPPNPTGNALVRTVWVLLCSVAELKQLVGGPGGCRAAELGRGARKSCIRWERCFLQEQQTISLAQSQMSLCCGSNTIFSLSPL